MYDPILRRNCNKLSIHFTKFVVVLQLWISMSIVMERVKRVERLLKLCSNAGLTYQAFSNYRELLSLRHWETRGITRLTFCWFINRHGH